MKVIVISGATATGKTDLSVELARKLGGEIVNFDSLLLYKEITIGTAKPTKLEQGEIPHHMIDVSSISNPLNAADYARMALPIINQLIKEKKLVYVVGGSGFYLQALLKGMYESPSPPKEILERSEALYRTEGIAAFRDILRVHDLATYTRYHENDHYRIRRAVEHLWTTGVPLSFERARKDKNNQELNQPSVHGWEMLHLHLDIPKEEHLKIIEARTQRMLNAGLLEEVQGLLNLGFTGLEKPLQSIGYKEVLDLHFGLLKDITVCKERIIISTRQLAKSQRTWFNRIPGKLTFHPLQEKEALLKAIKNFLSP